MEKTRLHNIPEIPANYSTLPFGRQLEYTRKISKFCGDSQKTYVSIKGSKRPLTEIKKTLKLYGGKFYYAEFFNNANVRDDVFTLYFQ